MQTGAITQYIDVAQLVLYAFWLFFALLILYLLRENKREGYPLDSDRRGGVSVVGFPKPPATPKTFRLMHGGTVTVPRAEPDYPPLAAVPAAAWPGAPLIPTGDPMRDAVGPASYAMRADTPDLTIDGSIKIVPMRTVADCGVEDQDPDPRGMTVVDAQGKTAGTVTDLWIDRSEMVFRYLECEAADGGARVLVPMPLVRIDGRKRTVKLNSIAAKQFAHAPKPKQAESITFREEDQLSAYFASGHLYAYPGRTESAL